MAGGQRLFLPPSPFTFKMNDALQTARIQLILCLGPTNLNLSLWNFSKLNLGVKNFYRRAGLPFAAAFFFAQPFPALR